MAVWNSHSKLIFIVFDVRDLHAHFICRFVLNENSTRNAGRRQGEAMLLSVRETISQIRSQ